ncbi:MAG TPA: 4Fe-4S dicluster domain-containing protein [Firmicutes bacterium]|nr:4Fe-4S dicluster domain-containing protein [Bacillota bacterium]
MKRKAAAVSIESKESDEVSVESKTTVTAERKTEIEHKTVSIHVMGRQYEVPENLTIMKALEFAGYQLVRGCGCRGGVCGACGTVFRTPDSHRVEVGLACQTMVKPDMFLAQIPFFPANKAIYDVETLRPEPSTISAHYPEIFKCIGCGTCTRTCPLDIDVMDYMAAAIRGDIARVAELSFDCVMCGLCSARCPAEEAQQLVAILCRRIYGRHIAPKAQHLKERVEQIDSGKFDDELEELMQSALDVLKKLYTSRESEPDLPDTSWRPKDKSHL